MLFEHPLNERIRNFFNLEYYLNQANKALEPRSEWQIIYGTYCIVALITFIERHDVRSDLLKEIDRKLNFLNKLNVSPELDPGHFNNTVNQLKNISEKIKITESKLDNELKNDYLLNILKQKININPAALAFDVPVVRYWLYQAEIERNQQLTHWLNSLKWLQDAVYSVLDLSRQGSEFIPVTAENGIFQKSLDNQRPCQIIRILTNSNTKIFPEISGTAHRINIRFLMPTLHNNQKPTLYNVGENKNLEFELSCCFF